MADCNQIVPLPMKLAPSSVMSWKKEAKYILNRKRVLRVCKSHFYSAKHFTAPAFKKVPYLVFDPDIFIFLRDKANGIKTILLCLFSLNITRNDFPVTQKWAALHSWVLLFASLKTCSVYRVFYSDRAIAKKKKKKPQKFDWTMARLTMRKITE